jgi:NAD(P)-dependent dehydrogenase (short-subunit alcohol dehydrogenase family)
MEITVISGASRGIGKAIADNLESAGCNVIRLNSKDIDLFYYDKVGGGISKRLSGRGCKKINLVLCAALVGVPHSLNLSNMDKLYRINVLGNLAIIKECMTYDVPMRIVWFSGGGAAFPFPEFFGYSLSKTAVVRAVENLSMLLNKDSSIIALAPGAVNTDMLKTVMQAGCKPRTRTDISEPVDFVRKFLLDEIDSLSLNGRFIHVRDNINREGKDMYKLRRIE